MIVCCKCSMPIRRKDGEHWTLLSMMYDVMRNLLAMYCYVKENRKYLREDKCTWFIGNTENIWILQKTMLYQFLVLYIFNSNINIYFKWSNSTVVDRIQRNSQNMYREIVYTLQIFLLYILQPLYACHVSHLSLTMNITAKDID